MPLLVGEVTGTCWPFFAFDKGGRGNCVRGGSLVDISVIIRWIVVFLIIFILLMFFVFSLFRKQSG